MPEAGEVAVHVAPLAKGEHLVDPYTGESLCVGLDRIQSRHRLAVALAADEVAALADMSEDGLARTALLLERRPYGQWMGLIYAIGCSICTRRMMARPFRQAHCHNYLIS